MKKLMTLSEFNELPHDIKDGIRQGIEDGFNQWQAIRAMAASLTPEPLCYDNTTHCNAIQDHIQGRLKTIFADNADIKIDKFKDDVLGLLYKGVAFIRFNKLSEDFKPKTKLTPSHQKYLDQDPDLPGLPSTATILFAGYIPDAVMSTIRAINVVCWAADGLEWVYDYSSQTGTEQTGLGFAPTVPDSPIVEIGKTASKSRISKKVNKKKTESDTQ